MDLNSTATNVIGIILQSIQTVVSIATLSNDSTDNSEKVRPEIDRLTNQARATCSEFSKKIGDLRASFGNSGVPVEATIREVEQDIKWYQLRKNLIVRDFRNDIRGVEQMLIDLSGDVIAVVACSGRYRLMVEAQRISNEFRQEVNLIDLEQDSLDSILKKLEKMALDITRILDQRVMR